MRKGDLGAAWRVLALVCAASFVSTLDITVVVVAFNDIRESFSNVRFFPAGRRNMVIDAWLIDRGGLGGAVDRSAKGVGVAA